MRVRLQPAVLKEVNKHRKTLSPTAEVNRALDCYYTEKKEKELTVKKPNDPR